MSIVLRSITADEFPALGLALTKGFGSSPWNEEQIDDERLAFEYDRSIAAFDGTQIVGTAGAFSFCMTLPGFTTAPAAGVTWVTVLPTHRRRGILRSMMERQLRDIREREEPLAILLAAESTIYNRFGYGQSTFQADLEIDKRFGALQYAANGSGTVSLVDAEAALGIFPGVYDQVRQRTPGALTRSSDWWKHYMLDRERWREGMSTRFYAVYQTASGAYEGYISYRIGNKWEHGNAQNTLWVGEMMTVTPEALTALWQYVTNVDLVTSVQLQNRPIDEPLRWMLTDTRRLRTTQVSDFLWTRLVDIPAALSARRYSATDRLLFEVHDSFCPDNSGCYVLEAGPDGAECQRVTASPDLSLGVMDLGATYLGGVRFSTLAGALRITEYTPGSVARADAMFASNPYPWCATPF